MKVYIDTETTGLPLMHGWNSFYNPSYFPAYDSSRIVSIALLFYKKEVLISQKYFVVYPEAFVIPKSPVHDITHDYALQHGKKWQVILEDIKDILKCKKFKAYNVSFDYNVFMSELLRIGSPLSYQFAKKLTRMKKSCIMKECQTRLGLGRVIKLIDLYNLIFDKDFNAHNALDDIIASKRCEDFLS